MEPIKAIDIKKGMKISELVDGFNDMGFNANKIAKASEVLKEMKKDKDCKKFFGFAGAMVPAGMKKIVIDMIKEEYIDVFVTTGANITHDLMEALGENHYKGDSNIDDKKLNEKGIDRIYNVFMKNSVYEKLEDFFEKNWDEISKTKDVKEFLWKIGELIDSKDSILRICYEKKIPIFCPAITDSGIGLMVWGRIAKGKKIEVNAFEDMKEIIDLAWTSKKNGLVYIGGGTPKNYIQQSLQFSKGADYGIQITTDRPEPGGSSGAPLKEGISWGKMNEKAKFVDVFCDATIALPLIYGSVKE
jgi:deoxyhypusine synthase